jgi:hypothetical protein
MKAKDATLQPMENNPAKRLAKLEFVRILPLLDQTLNEKIVAAHRLHEMRRVDFWRQHYLTATVKSWAIIIIAYKKLIPDRPVLWKIVPSPEGEELLGPNRSILEEMSDIRSELWRPSFLAEVIPTLKLISRATEVELELDRKSLGWVDFAQTVRCVERLTRGTAPTRSRLSRQDVCSAARGDSWFGEIVQSLAGIEFPGPVSRL